MSEESAGILDKIMGSRTQSSLNDFQPISLVEQLLSILKQRDREIIIKRFGLLGSEVETLESIGKQYNLTRERVRQIEKDSINFFKKNKTSELNQALQLIFDSILEHGSIISGEFLMQTMMVDKSDQKEKAAVAFLLNLGDQFKNLKESSKFYESWYIVGFDLAKLEDTVAQFIEILKSTGKAIGSNQIYDEIKKTPFYQSRQLELTDKVLKSYLNIAKAIRINPFNEIGLSNWAEVSPRDVGDKAYLVLKHHGKPEHYSNITTMINNHKFDRRVAYRETVHNELIKDKRFVLVGRGIYALSEWGYKKGVVADVIAEILKSFGRALSREEIISEVLKRRQVKRNTILVGLSNRKKFQKVGKDKYVLADVAS